MRSALNRVRTGRLTLAAIGLMATVTMTVACSSSTAGNPSTNTGNTGNAGSTNAGATTGAVAPTATVPMSSSVSVPTLSGSKFCTDAGQVAKVGSALSGQGLSALKKVIQSIDALTAEAPSEVKGDLQTLSTELHKAMSGKVDKNMMSKLSTAGQHIETYIATHCKAS